MKTTKKEITELKGKLNKIETEKEISFFKKEELIKKISTIINTVKDLRDSNQQLRKSINENKQKRDASNKKTKALIEKIKLSKIQHMDLFTKFKLNPSILKKKLVMLETKIETEALKFNAEKKITEEINKLKRKLKGLKEIEDLAKKIYKNSELIEVTKKLANSFHENFKNFSKEIKDNATKVKKMLSELNPIKKQQKAAFKDFINHKNNFSKISVELIAKLKEFHQESRKIYEEKKNLEEVKQKEKHDLIKKKQKNIEIKIKSGDKITTEDLVTLRGEE